MGKILILEKTFKKSKRNRESDVTQKKKTFQQDCYFVAAQLTTAYVVNDEVIAY